MQSSSAKSSTPFRLIVEPMCGLCNRMRVIDGAYSLAAKRNGTVSVIWFCDSDINCRFSDLFQPLPSSVRFWHFSLPPSIETRFKRLLHAVMRRTCGRFLLEAEMDRLVNEGHDFSELTLHHRVFLKTWNRMSETEPPFAIFHPVNRIQAIIDRQAQDLPNAVGVHIRRTDCTSAVENSTTEKFVSQMRSELKEDPNTTFFIATDDPVEENLMSSFFPGKIITYKKRTRSRNERLGIEDAVVDLYCLARCKKILGSFNSSFSATAMAISRQPSIYIQ
jgi:hypothetical protein